jgi:hypothetical protein
MDSGVSADPALDFEIRVVGGKERAVLPNNGDGGVFDASRRHVAPAAKPGVVEVVHEELSGHVDDLLCLCVSVARTRGKNFSDEHARGANVDSASPDHPDRWDPKERVEG